MDRLGTCYWEVEERKNAPLAEWEEEDWQVEPLVYEAHLFEPSA